MTLSGLNLLTQFGCLKLFNSSPPKSRPCSTFLNSVATSWLYNGPGNAFCKHLFIPAEYTANVGATTSHMWFIRLHFPGQSASVAHGIWFPSVWNKHLNIAPDCVLIPLKKDPDCCSCDCIIVENSFLFSDLNALSNFAPSLQQLLTTGLNLLILNLFPVFGFSIQHCLSCNCLLQHGSSIYAFDVLLFSKHAEVVSVTVSTMVLFINDAFTPFDGLNAKSDSLKSIPTILTHPPCSVSSFCPNALMFCPNASISTFGDFMKSSNSLSISFTTSIILL
mmetsp:Transcript_12792/g.19255  ORF Transcript_12792/g.19255 Transcript_12792/m.19255 type:complete len:278 (-) Transcript_12792:116-949(-)